MKIKLQFEGPVTMEIDGVAGMQKEDVINIFKEIVEGMDDNAQITVPETENEWQKVKDNGNIEMLGFWDFYSVKDIASKPNSIQCVNCRKNGVYVKEIETGESKVFCLHCETELATMPE